MKFLPESHHSPVNIIKQMEEPTLKKTIKLTPGNRKQKGRRSEPKNRVIGKKNQDSGYEYKDKNIGVFRVLPTDNGWWKDPTKLTILISAYKMYGTDAQACYSAGITERQLEYFQKLHPQFCGIKHLCKEDLKLRAKQKIAKKIADGDDVELCKWMLEKTEKENYSSRTEQTGPNGRELYNPEIDQVAKLVAVMKSKYDEEHTGDTESGNTDAESRGDGSDTGPATS